MLLLTALLLLLLILSIVIFNKEYINPAIIVCATFFLSSLSGMIYWRSSNVTISLETVYIISGALIVIIVVQFLISLQFQKSDMIHRTRLNYNNCKQEYKLINLSRAAQMLITLLISAGIVVYVSQIISIGIKYSASGNLNDILIAYRLATSYTDVSNETINYVIELIYRLSTISGYVFMYITINNYFVNAKLDKRTALMAVLVILSTLFGGGRQGIMRAFTMIITLLYFFSKTTTSINKVRFNFSLAKVLLIILVAFMLFEGARVIIGRETKHSNVEDLMLYLGQPIINLDMFLKDSIKTPRVWGEETFYAINNMFGRITGNRKYLYMIHKEFRYINGISRGNVYTGFRNYIHDFGYIGLFVMTTIWAMVTSASFCTIKRIVMRKKLISKINTQLLVYSYYTIYIYMLFFNDTLFQQFFSVGTLVDIVIIFSIVKGIERLDRLNSRRVMQSYACVGR
jgi:oligosaccharide repeat unit polymerase